MELRTFAYTSWARPSITQRDVDEVLAISRINNPLDGITGLLVFNGTSFFQIIEGEASAVDGLKSRLKRDARHSNILIRSEGEIEARVFPHWSMAYVSVDDGRFVGKDELIEALHRVLPANLRNVILGLTHSLDLKLAAK